jgi:hypothetical protein
MKSRRFKSAKFYRMSEPEAKKDPVVSLLEEVRDELRGKEKRWFQKTPFKEMLIHSSTVLFAGCVGWLAHAASGGAVNIEVAQRASMPGAAVAASPPEVPADIEQEVVAAAPPATVTVTVTSPPAKLKKDNALAVAVIPKPPPPAAPPASARPAPAAAPAQAVDSR